MQYEQFVCLCSPCVHGAQARIEHQIPYTCRPQATMWVLGTKPGSSAIAASALTTDLLPSSAWDTDPPGWRLSCLLLTTEIIFI